MVKLGKISGGSFVSLFYLASGIALLAALVQSSSPPLHVGLLGVLSLIASYGLNRMKRWGFYLAVLTALPGISFGCVTIYAVYRMFEPSLTEVLLLSAMVIYVALSVFSLLYVAGKRDKFV
ncbi:MAG: hypothetical protein GTO54_11880 [Nitrososphaeria archaeon]|nr:hypothetical protein [Nitrososphaeria archaeon]